MIPTGAADDWSTAEHAARKIAESLSAGDYWYRWTDYADESDEPGEMLAQEVRRALNARSLMIVSDDLGMRVEAQS